MARRQDDLGTGGGMARAARTNRPAAAIKKPWWRRGRGFWLRQLHTWHWISAAISLAGMFLFAVTGLLLNHAESIGATPRTTHHETTLPRALLAALDTPHSGDRPLPGSVSTYLAPRLGLDPAGRAVDWSDEEADVSLPGPGRDASLAIDRKTGLATSDVTERGWIAYLNDLHKGRNTGPVWFWFIDGFAIACMVFTLTGLVILQMHARNRRATWPLVGAGLAIPFVLALLFIH